MMNELLHITQASFQDLDDVSVLFDQYRSYYGQASDPVGARAFLFRLMEHRESVIFLARNGQHGDAVGFAQLYPVFSSISMQRSWILNDLFVIESSRGHGAGRKLLSEVSEFAKRSMAKGIALETGIENKKAQKLYEDLGYARDDDFYHYYLKL